MLKIVADHKIPFLQGALEPVARVEYLPGARISREHLLDADAIITRTRTRCNEALLEGTPVKFIATATIGYDHIDTEYCDSKGISWTNAPGCNSASVRQYIASALATIITKTGKPYSDFTLGIVGAGNVGTKVEFMARTLGMNVLVNDPPRVAAGHQGNFCELEQLIAESDIITMHVPLTMTGEYATWHMAGEKFFEGMKTGAWFINSSRGEVHDTQALKNALTSGKLSGIILDVWENEPEIDLQLMDYALIATPHIAGYSADGKANGTSMSVQAISRFFGLGLDNWYPASIPPALINQLIIDGNNKGDGEILSQLNLLAYNICADTLRLKTSPKSFELLRETYPIRREPHALTAVFQNQPDMQEVIRIAEALGYEIVIQELSNKHNNQI
jgi:erythronate-4-phosphate dehydrogenase